MDAGCVIGEAGFLLGTPRGASVEAITDAEVAVLNHKKVADAFAARPERECYCRHATVCLIRLHTHTPAHSACACV
jgi:hypothetical protein